MIDYRRLRTDLLALGLLGAAVFLGLSLLSYDPADPPAPLVYPAHAQALNLCGRAGAIVAHHLFNALGLGAWPLLGGLVLLDLRLFSRREWTDPYVRLFGAGLLLVSVCVGLHQLIPGLGAPSSAGSGGYLGAWGCVLLEQHVTLTGRLILLASTCCAGLLLTSEFAPFRLAFRVAALPFRVLPGLRPIPTTGAETVVVESPSAKPSDDPELDAVAEPSELPDVAEGPPLPKPTQPAPRKPIKVNPPVTAKSAREEMLERLEAGSEFVRDEAYRHPDLALLEDAEEFPYELLAKKAQVAAVTLEKTFQEFGLNVKVAEIDTGPVITQFELELEAGLRLSKITALADDLAIALRVPAVRVVAPIPGKNTVGVEVPNDVRVMVRLRELIESCPKTLDDMRIPIFLGKDVSGHPLVVDLCKMPHLLIAGRTGTGKSVCLNTLILSMLMTRSPDQVKMLMIDPKMVELSPYMRVPHLMHPVITDMKKAEAVLAWAVDKMEERYDLLARCGVRHLDSYNKLGKAKVLDRLDIDPESEEAERIPEHMPYIVIIADEMADMIMTSGKDVEGHIIRLAQKSRAVGIHLVLATQKPTVDVITGLIKSNLPARISFQVASRTDSRVVLDEMGAERLLGNGDMLYLAPGTSNVTRAQGTYVSDDEINAVLDFFSDQEPEYSAELAQLSTSSSSKSGEPGANRQRDDLYDQAVEIVIREGRGSTSLLQRAMGIGYGRAARLIDYMAEDGIVGDYNGSQAREVLYTLEQWEDLQAARDETAVVG